MILSGKKIIDELSLGNITIEPFDLRQVGPNSYDILLGEFIQEVWENTTKGIDPRLPMQMGTKRSLKDYPNGFLLNPGTLYLAHTNEVAGSSKYVPMIEGRSSWGRMGLFIHSTAGFGDLGFIGSWTLELSCIVPIRIRYLDRIGQVYFQEVSGEVKSYNGKYNNVVGDFKVSESYRDYQGE